MKRIRYLNIDMSRAFGSWKIAVGSLGVCLTLLYNSSGAVSVLGWLSNIAGNAVLIMAALIFLFILMRQRFVMIWNIAMTDRWC